MSSFFGHTFKIATFGESHGSGVGVVIDGVPAGLRLDTAAIQVALDRRRPGQGELTSPRKEADQLEVLAGLERGDSTSGAPLCFFVRNMDQRPADYSAAQKVYRPGHAERSYELKYGSIPRSGGGRASARETIARVAAGDVARQLLEKVSPKLSVYSYVRSIGEVTAGPRLPSELGARDPALSLENLYCFDPEARQKMFAAIEAARLARDSLGGVISCRIEGCPPGLGEPVFDKLEADLAKAMMSLPASRGFELGGGFSLARQRGSLANDDWVLDPASGEVQTKTQSSGGILGGISFGGPIEFHVAFKPVSSIGLPQKTLTREGQEAAVLELGGRHDPCVLPRAVPIVEAMTYLVLADHLLRQKAQALLI